MKEKVVLSSKERILLSRIYKLDRQINTFMMNHRDKSMNELIPQTDFIKKAYDLYSQMNQELIDISLKKTKYTQNLVDLRKFK